MPCLLLHLVLARHVELEQVSRARSFARRECWPAAEAGLHNKSLGNELAFDRSGMSSKDQLAKCSKSSSSIPLARVGSWPWWIHVQGK